MSEWSGQTRGNLLGYRIFVSILRSFGPRAAYLLLYFVAFYFVFFSPKSTKFVYRFLRRKINKGFLPSLIGIYKTYFVFGQTLIDKVAILSGMRNKYTYEFDGRENLQEIVDRKQGGVLISGHLGNWDIAANFLNEINNIDEVYVVMMDAEHQQIKSFLEATQSEKQFNVIPIKEDGSHIFKIHQVLSNNKLICIHADRYVEGQKTLAFDFMGEQAKLPIGPFKMAAALKKPFSFVFALKEGKSHYHLFSSPLKNQDCSYKEIMQLFVSDLEKKARTYPYQWFNFYNFWQNTSDE